LALHQPEQAGRGEIQDPTLEAAGASEVLGQGADFLRGYTPHRVE
jgi:hypothetical protein